MSEPFNIPLSMLDLVPVRQGGSVADALKESVALARHVEALGYRRYWLAEHHNMDGIASSATAVLIGHVAGHTARIRVGSGGVMLPNHAPLVVAENFGTLATLYPGRIDLGLGRAPGADRATMRALRRDLAGNGEDFPQQVAELRTLLAPAQPGQAVRAMPGAGTEVPVWLLGSSLFSAQLAAQLGLPYAFAAHFAPRMMLQAARLYRELFRPSAVLDRPHLMLGVPVVAADSDDEARGLFTSVQQRVLALLRGESLRLRPPVADMTPLWASHEKASVDAFLAEAVVGGPDTVRRGLASLVERTGADELMVVTDIHDFALRLRSCRIVAEVAGVSAEPAVA
ncbi:MAG: LLM class flavin-dependent oxidoreductase [Methyloversatilis sp.]|jgi:luciferase family oxidoreductase group 1|nr:LLM class flavin-dependent oxidoreductase [Methyloversatilis sp.]